jgi:hypothetical protein
LQRIYITRRCIASGIAMTIVKKRKKRKKREWNVMTKSYFSKAAE